MLKTNILNGFKSVFLKQGKNIFSILIILLVIFIGHLSLSTAQDCTDPSCQVLNYNYCPDGVNYYVNDVSECPGSATTYSCPADQVLVGNTCYNAYSNTTNTTYTCPTGQYEYNGYCYSYQDQTNVSINPYTQPSYQQNTGGYMQPAYNYPLYGYGSSYGNYGSLYYPTTYPTTPVQQQPMIQCWNGTYVYSASQCPIQTQTCWNGQVIAMNQSCPAQTQTCPNGQVISINQVCPTQTQTCWNGLVVPVTQTCPSQYQTCWDGSVIPVMQSCPVKTTTRVVVKQVQIIDHSVVTNTPTKVSQTSAECNGVALISNGADSVGWFEFGSTQNLGKTTNSADIGNMSQSSFSNIISGLKSSTTYYCRAVMANRDGTYRGKIVSFTTLAASKKSVVYASPKKSVTTKPKTKTEFVCSDGSIAVAKTVSVADTVNGGGKLLSIKIERSAPDLVQGSTVNYRISITNDSDTAVSGAETKITLPSELSFVDATTTGGVTVKDNVMTVPIGDINSKEVKTFILPAKVSPTALVGKAVITTVYASYNLPVTGSQVVKDEVSAYMTANIVASGVGSTAASASVASVLFPQTLLGWLVLFAVILIIVVLVMNIRRWLAERKLEKEETIHHHKAE